MNWCYILAVLVGSVLVVSCQNLGEQAIDISKFKPGEDKRFNVKYDIGAAGKGTRNFGGGVNAGVGAKVWESKNGKASFGVGATYQRDYARHQGRTYKGRPNFGYGANFQYRFKGK